MQPHGLLKKLPVRRQFVDALLRSSYCYQQKQAAACTCFFKVKKASVIQ
jgi:hypothetical protein